MDKHGVAKREKPIAFRDGGVVGVQDMLAPGQSRDKHNQRALRQVEIGDKRVDALEAVAGIDENAGPAGRGLQRPVLGCEALERAAGGRADRNDAAAAAFGFIDRVRGLLG